MTHVHKAGLYLREQMSPWAIALLALITAVAFTLPFLLNSPAGAIDGPAGEPTTTHGVQPDFEANNPTECTFSDAPEGFRINAPSSGTFTDPDNLDFEITLTIPSTNPPDPRLHEGPTFDFVADGGVVEDMLVKGGPDANAYDFDGQLGAGVVSDTYLHSPVNPNNDNYYGLSHIDVCYNPTVTKSGTKFHDRNADGDRDTGDEGLSGWTIKAYNDNDSSGDLSAGDTLEASTTTDGNGDYSLELSVGEYIVCEELQTGWEQSTPDNTVCENADVDATLAPGGYAVNLVADESGNDFGNFEPASKSGVKFEDDNADGDQDTGEDVISGWTIKVFNDVDSSGDLSTGDTLEASTTTDGTGAYSFTLDPGDYIVCEVIQTDWFQSAPDNMVCENDDVDATLAPSGFAISLSSGDVDDDNDFGNFQQATKSGVKFKDVNADGARDADGADDIAGNDDDEVGLSGWTIKVFNDNDSSGDLSTGDTLEASTTTDGTGAYSFTLDPGDYIVCEAAQDNWEQTAPSNTDCDFDAIDGTLADGGFGITLISGGTDSDNDFGNTPLSDFDVRFFDLTGFTDAEIECVVEGTTDGVGSTTTDDIDDGTADPEETLEAQGLQIGTYVCTITITDP